MFDFNTLPFTLSSAFSFSHIRGLAFCPRSARGLGCFSILSCSLSSCGLKLAERFDIQSGIQILFVWDMVVISFEGSFLRRFVRLVRMGKQFISPNCWVRAPFLTDFLAFDYSEWLEWLHGMLYTFN